MLSRAMSMLMIVSMPLVSRQGGSDHGEGATIPNMHTPTGSIVMSQLVNLLGLPKGLTGQPIPDPAKPVPRRPGYG